MRFLLPALLFPFAALAQSSADKRPRETDAPALSPAEAAKKGQPIYKQRCAVCHTLWNKGGKAGPDLTSYQRTDLDMLLLAMIAPSAEIREGFATNVIETKDGATLAGFISDQAGDTLVLRDAAGQTHTISKDRITKQTPLPGSLMPEGLLAGLTDQELRDFIACLRSTTPPF